MIGTALILLQETCEKFDRERFLKGRLVGVLRQHGDVTKFWKKFEAVNVIS